jgi:hypothetical protein
MANVEGMKRLLIYIGLALMLAACAPDPRKQAEADATRMQAESQAASDAQQRQFAQDAHALDMQVAQAEVAGRQATAAAQAAARQRVILWTSIFGVVGLCAMIVLAAYGFGRAFVGLGQAAAIYATRRSKLMANIIPLDQVTRQYPLLMQRVGGGEYALVNPNVGSVMLLNIRKVEDRQMIAAAGAVQFAGALAHEARQSSDPAAMSMITAPIVGAIQPKLDIGLSTTNALRSLEGVGDEQ